jgi:hypothetical protein
MPVKTLKAKQRQSAVRSSAKPARKAKVLKPEFTPEEVATFETQLALHKQAENAWQRLTSPPDGDDRWSEVEESLLSKSESRGTAERRWKYFSK